MSLSTLPLTGAQQGIWTAQSLNPESPFYVVGEVLQLGPGHIELEILQRSIVQLQQEADTLRVRISLQGGVPRQFVAQQDPDMPRVIDVRGAADPQRTAEAWVDALRAESAEVMRSMVDQPLCRYAIILLDAESTWVVQLYHHLIVDGFSASLLTRRLGQIYTALVAGTAPRPFRADPLSELVRLDKEYRESEDYIRDTQYWRSVLAALPEGTDRAAMNAVAIADGAGQTTITTPVHLEPEVREQLNVTAREEQITWVELMIALYGAFVHRLCSPQSVSEQVLAVPVMARVHASELRTPSMAVNVLPLRVKVDNAQSVQEYLRHAAKALCGLLAHQRLRGEELPHITGNPRVADVLHGVGVNAKAFTTRADFAGVSGWLRNVAGGPPEDLGLVLAPAEDGGLDMAFETDPARVSAEQARDRLEALREFTHQALGDPCRTIGDLELLSRAQREEMLDRRASPESGACESAVPPDVPDTLDALGTALATMDRRTQAHLVVHSAGGWGAIGRGIGSAPGVVANSEVLDAQTLHAAVYRVAGYFQQEVLGGTQWRRAQQSEQVEPRPVLALELGRGRELILAVLAAFAAGVPFVVLDPGSPARRRSQILADAEPVVHVDKRAIRRALDAPAARAVSPDPEQLAYLIYTSGSAGQPKGVEVPRRAINALFSQHCRGLYNRPHAVVAHTAAFTFDAAFDQLLWLLAGHDVHLYPWQAAGDADRLVEHFAAQRISVVDTTPSMMKALLAAQLLEKVPSLQLVVLGGEELPAELWDRLAATDLEVINAYGPTECTVDALLADVQPGMPHLGRPVPGMRAYLVDSALQLVGDGEVGELVLAGPQLALGYRGLPDVTAAAFVEDVTIDPRRAPERIYRTGDRARWVPGRGYEFLGRADEQVEINGQRVELAEVEAAMVSLTSVRDCVVAPLKRGGQDTVLIAAIITDGHTGSRDLEFLRSQLRGILPAAVIPRRIHFVEALPTTISGKIDRKAIAALGLQPQSNGAPRDSHGTAAASAPMDPLAALDSAHRLLHRTVCEVLQLPPEQADPHQDFISLGGESIAALHVASQARQGGLLVQPRDLLAGTALAQIPVDLQAAHLTKHPTGRRPEELGAIAAGEGNVRSLDWGELPWTPVVRMQIAAAPTTRAMRRHVMYCWMDVPAGRERDDLLRAVEALQLRHGSLRMLLDWNNHAQLIPRMSLASAEEIVVELVADGGDAVEQLAARIAPDRGVMWQVGLCGERALVMVHHLAIDAVSWQNLQRDWDVLMVDATAKLPVLTGLLRAQGMERAGRAGMLERTPQIGKMLCPRAEATVVWRELAMADAAAVSSAVARRFRAGRQAVVVSLVARALCSVGLGEYQLVLEGHGRDAGAVDCTALVGWFTREEYWDVPRDETSTSDAGARVRAARLAETKAQPWDEQMTGATINLQRRVVVNVLETQLQRSFGVLESSERRMTEALTINVFLAGDGAKVEYVADLVALGRVAPEILDELHEHLQEAARDLLVADRLGLRQALPSDYQLDGLLSAAHLRRLEAIHGPLEDIAPATAPQQGLLFHALAGSDDDRYVIAASVDLVGVDSPERIHRVMRAILRRHAALRAVFDCSEQPLMLIPERLNLPWQVHDCRDLSSATAHALVEQLRELRALRSMDLEAGPLVTADLVLLPEPTELQPTQPATLVLGSHHVLTDGWSTTVMLQDLQRLLNGEELGCAPSFAEHARELYRRSPEEREREHRVWRQMLTADGQTTVAGDYGGMVARLRQQASNDIDVTNKTPEVLQRLHRDTDGRVTSVATSLGTTPSVIVQTAWLLTLAALHGGRRVTTGVTLSGRSVDQPWMASTVGMFITTLPLHVYLAPERTLRETVRQVADTMALISDNQATPLPDIERLAGSAPLFDTAVVYDHHAHLGAPGSPWTAQTRIEGLRVAGRTHFPMTVVCPPGDVLEITLAHHPNMLDSLISDAAVRWFTTFLDALCGGEDRLEASLAELLPERGEFEVPECGAGASGGGVNVGGAAEKAVADPVCHQVQAAMQQLLGHPIGSEENFFDSGGDSLLAMRLMGVLRKKGLRVKIQDIVDAGTPAAIATRLGETVPGSERGLQPQWQPRQLSQSQPHRPLWCIHPIGGHGLAFGPLARILAPTHVEARLIELPNPLPQVNTLAELAELYTSQILEQQPQGPFALVGYSFGGMVAEGIAAALQRRGHEVEFLGVLDASPCGSAPQTTSAGDYDVRAIARADGMSHDMGALGVDIENNINFCMGMLRTARPTSYDGIVELVVATRNAGDAVRGQWDPAAAWRRKGCDVRVNELELTHAQLVQESGWRQVYQQWKSRILGQDAAACPGHKETGKD